MLNLNNHVQQIQWFHLHQEKHLDLFDNTTQQLAKQLDQVQREATVMIKQTYRRTPPCKLLKETGLISLADRHKAHRLTY